MLPDNRNKLAFPWENAPAVGERTTIIEGIDWIKLPLPFALNHVNCWHLHAEGESCLIDTGVHDNTTLQCWNALFDGIDWPQTLLVTHYHPDHSGLAGWFAQHGAKVLSSKIEWEMIERLVAIETSAYQTIYKDWYSANGVDQPYIDALDKIGNGYKAKSVPPPATCDFLANCDSVQLGGRSFSVLTGQGHSPDMVMLYSKDDNLLIAADQVLPSITPNVSWMPNTSDANPLQSFLASLNKLRELPEETLVLPSHGLPFTGLHQRIEFLLDHHQKRLHEIELALTTPHTATELFPLLFKRKLDNQQLSFALGETLAHLIYLQGQSKVERETHDGVNYYQASS